MEYKLIRSGRRTLALEIKRGGELIVRAPYSISMGRIEKFLEEKREWIEKNVEKMKNFKPMASFPSKDTFELRKMADEMIPPKVEYYSKLMGVDPKGLRITSAQKRFGSCSSRGTLCFSLYLMQYPDEAIDYVVVHELAHLVELNHSKSFWAVVEKYMPNYKRCRAILKE